MGLHSQIMKAMYNSNTEIRKLRPAELYTLAQILSVSDNWKRLMAIVPKDTSIDIPKFTSEHFTIIEQAVLQQHQNAAEIFLEEWSTMGKHRPTLRSTLNLLVKAELFRAADYIAVNLLNEQPPSRPYNGLAANIDISEEEIAKLLKQQQLISDDCETESTCYDFEETDEGEVIQIEYTCGSYVQNLCAAKCVHSNSDNVSKLKQEPVTENSQISQEHTTDSNFIKFTSSVTRVQQDDQGFKQEVAWKQIEGSKEETSLEQVQECKKAMTLKQDESYKSEVSNLREDEKEVSEQDQIYREELMSQALPLCVADFGREQSSIQPEVMSDELPVFVNEVARQKEESKTLFSSSDNSASNYTTSLRSLNLPIFDAIIPSNTESDNLQPYGDNRSNSDNNNFTLPVIEVTSSELPQVIVELALKNK